MFGFLEETLVSHLLDKKTSSKHRHHVVRTSLPWRHFEFRAGTNSVNEMGKKYPTENNIETTTDTKQSSQTLLIQKCSVQVFTHPASYKESMVFF